MTDMYFKDASGAVFCTTKELALERGLIEMTAAEVSALFAPVLSINELASMAQGRVDAEYMRCMGGVADAYPLHERESWPIQLAEARDLQELGEAAVTPWIDQCAEQRGLGRIELAQRILNKDLAYRSVSGFFSGVRQWHEDQIDALREKGEGGRRGLSTYDHMHGWNG